jgi:hypothetical protein
LSAELKANFSRKARVTLFPNADEKPNLRPVKKCEGSNNVGVISSVRQSRIQREARSSMIEDD